MDSLLQLYGFWQFLFCNLSLAAAASPFTCNDLKCTHIAVHVHGTEYGIFFVSIHYRFRRNVGLRVPGVQNAVKTWYAKIDIRVEGF